MSDSMTRITVKDLTAFIPDISLEQQAEIDKRIAESKSREKIRAMRDEGDKMASLIDNSMMAPRFRDRTFENYTISSDKQHAAVEAAKWLVAHPDSVGALFLGKTGTGKNHLAAAVGRAYLSRGQSVLFTEAIKIVRAIKDSWRTNTKEADIMRMFSLPALLVIDEIGVQFGTDTERLYISEVVNDRYMAMRPILICGNLTMKELTAIIGERSIDRFREDGKAVIFDWQSYRRRT